MAFIIEFDTLHEGLHRKRNVLSDDGDVDQVDVLDESKIGTMLRRMADAVERGDTAGHVTIPDGRHHAGGTVRVGVWAMSDDLAEMRADQAQAALRTVPTTTPDDL